MIPEAERDDSGQTKRAGLSAGTGGAIVTTTTVVDWPRLVRSLDLRWLVDAKTDTLIRDEMSKVAEPGHRLVVSKSAPDADSSKTGESAVPTELQQQMWNSVGGGVVTMFTRVSSDAASAPAQNGGDNEDSTELERALFGLYFKTQSIAAGMDFVPGGECEYVRLAIEPAAGQSASELVHELKKAQSIVMAALDSSPDNSPESGQTRKELIKQVRLLQVSVANSGGETFVMVSGPLPISKFLLTK